MTNKYRRARKKRKKWWPYLLSFFLLVVLGSGIGAYLAKPSLFSGLQFWKAKKQL
ncbi:D-alanyl-D-alanine carboxypeptidase [Streptococcus sp. ZB199]|nr:D-alanyl-D-alanine carboxypeptidase [Streptococcus sp. ZB199]